MAFAINCFSVPPERDDWEVNKPDLDLSTSVEFLRDFTSGEIKQRELKEETCLGFFFVDALEDGLELRIAIGELWRYVNDICRTRLVVYYL